MKISWLILTYNRAETVRRAMAHNAATAGCRWDEVIHVDNGSDAYDVISAVDDPVRGADITVLHKTNLGVAKGYNRAMALASGTHLVITGCDRLMPDGWLKMFRNEFENFPDTAVACMWERPHRERFMPHGVLPLGARMFKRELLQRAGYLREDFGLYGWEDVEWAHRVYRTCVEFGEKTTLLPVMPTHLGTEGCNPYDGADPADYHAFKKREAEDPAKRALFEKCKAEGFPYYNPFT